MHLHILGIGGTFMAGLARLAVETGHQVTGSDTALYPPMSTQLDALGVDIYDGYHADQLIPAPDLVIVGNALSRGNAAVEYVLSEGLPYVSGPAWLKDNILPGRHVIAVAGTHGKTTVASLLCWMLENAHRAPGFLVGGVIENFGISARLGAGEVFVIEADEYDTAFFDKRSKFIHYMPHTLIINNLEFDHADIFDDLEAIERQFHHLIRTLPREALIIRRHPDSAIDNVIKMGCWSRVTTFGRHENCAWQFNWVPEVDTLEIESPQATATRATTPLLGEHNAWNTLAAVAAAAEVGLEPADAVAALPSFENVKRRLELRGVRRGVQVFDDFAHHPTAIAATIAALRSEVGNQRIIAVTEPRSNTMRMGVHQDSLARALSEADVVAVLVPDEMEWNIEHALSTLPQCHFYSKTDELIAEIAALAQTDDHILIMSNGVFDNVHDRILDVLGDPP